jgi:hypothetical protein
MAYSISLRSCNTLSQHIVWKQARFHHLSWQWLIKVLLYPFGNVD